MTGPRQQTQPAEAPPEPSQEERFRDSLADVIAVVKKMAPLCKTPADLIGMLELAQVNDGQLAILWEQMNPVRFRT